VRRSGAGIPVRPPAPCYRAAHPTLRPPGTPNVTESEMTDTPPPSREGRLDNLAPGVPVEAKIALLLGLAGGLFVTIVLSYADPARQYWGLGIGIGLGLLCALVLALRAKR